MTTKTKFFKCVVLLNLVAVNGLGLIMFKNINEEQLIAKLGKILNEPDDSVQENHIAVRSSRKDLYDPHQKFERRKLIKTYLPHGQKVDFETNGDAMYKPLVRIHKKNKPIFKDHDAYKVTLDSTRNGMPIESDNEVTEPDRYKKLNKTKLSEETARVWNKMKALKYKYREKKPLDDKAEKHLRSLNFFNKTEFALDVSKLSNKFNNAFKKIHKNVDDQKEESLLNKLSKLFNPEDGMNLREGRSGEEHDPLAPGKVPFNIELYEETTPVVKQWQPEYSFWNYWTYDKSLHQDNCRGGLVKVGNRCIGSPPH